jgi:hypothetical protein
MISDSSALAIFCGGTALGLGIATIVFFITFVVLQ